MTTRLISLACHHCSAPLQVPDDVRFVTCSHCGASLTVERQGNVAYTRQMEEMAAKVDQIHDALIEDRRQQEQAEKLVRGMMGGPDGAFQAIGRVQRLMLPVMSLPVAGFFLFVGWHFHPLIGILMAAVPLAGATSMFLASRAITGRMGEIARRQGEAEVSGDENW